MGQCLQKFEESSDPHTWPNCQSNMKIRFFSDIQEVNHFTSYRPFLKKLLEDVYHCPKEKELRKRKAWDPGNRGEAKRIPKDDGERITIT